MRAVLLTVAAMLAVVPAARAGAIGIDVLSNRADLVSGDAALVAIDLPARADSSGLSVTVRGRDVSSAFARRANGRIEGVVTGLTPGANQVTARLGSDVARLTIVDHPLGGPVFSGPQITPWPCLPDTKGAQCAEPAKVSWQYKSSRGGFEAYDPAAPPSDVATTTTTQGKTVPYIVRVEKGGMDRGQYAIAVLADPKKPWSRWAPYAGWNRRVMVIFGESSATNYGEAAVASPLDDNALSHGFMVALNSLGSHGNNVNEVVAAESLLMLKEHIVNDFGDIDSTVGEGCSGGSMMQYIIAANYPGLLDGLIPSCSFPDMWSEISEMADCHLLDSYFRNAANAALWPNPVQQNEVLGKGPYPGCAIWSQTYSSLLDPTQSGYCNVPADQKYDPQSNPTGVRCTVQDYEVGIFGRRPPSEWGPVEKKIGHGFANRPYDNVGVQYGLAQLLSGEISPAQFVDLNAKIGGIDIDAAPVPERSQASSITLAIAYRTGQVTDARQWAKVPIIDIRGHSSVEWHQDYNSYSERARMDAAYGKHDNQVIWTGEVPLFVGPELSCSTTNGLPTDGLGGCTANALLAMDDWLTRIHADTTDASLAQKVVRNRPPGVTDACWVGGQRIEERATCQSLYPYYGSPRDAAGGPLANDILKCRLKPLSRSDYNVQFTDDEWAQLRRAFPSGVCDWSRPGVQQQGSTPWITYSDGPGGRPLGPPPTSQRVNGS